jgi:hypothetical protein
MRRVDMLRVLEGLLLLAITASAVVPALATESASSGSSKGAFIVKMYKDIPYIYSPGYGPGKMVFKTSSKGIVLKKEIWKWPIDEGSNLELGVKRVAGQSSDGWCCKPTYSYYCYMRFKDDFSHRLSMPHEYGPSSAEPGATSPVVFRMPDEYRAFWQRFIEDMAGSEKLKHYIDAEKAREYFAQEFLKNRPLSFKDSMTSIYGTETGKEAETGLDTILQAGTPSENQTVNAASRTASGAVYYDVLPGMRLGIQHRVYHSSPLPQANQSEREQRKRSGEKVKRNSDDGYVITSTEYCSVSLRHGFPLEGSMGSACGDWSKGFLAFDPFVGFLKQYFDILETSDLGWPRRVWSVIDLHHKTARCTFYRLRIPVNFGNGNSPDTVDLKSQYALIGSNNASDLSAAKLEELFNEPVALHSRGQEAPFVHTFGPDVVTLEVRIPIGNNRSYEAIGTTFCEAVGKLQDWEEYRVAPRVKLLRPIRGALAPVHFDGENPRVFEIPILKGDQLTY